MKRLAEALYSISIALWVGGLWAVGFLVAPILFAQLPDRVLAGSLGSDLFALTAQIGFVLGGYLLLFLFSRLGRGAFKSRVFWIVVLMLLLNVAGHFGIRPVIAQLRAEALPLSVMESALRGRFSMWHGISSVLYLVQASLGLLLAVFQGRGKI